MNATAQVIEFFRDEDMSPIILKKVHTVESEQHALLQSLGMNEQLKLVRGEAIAPEVGNVYELLEGINHQIWRMFLPKRYSKRDGDWEEYRFDIIPLEVLNEIKEIDSIGVFDDLEIWTPEKANIDPLLVGVVDTRWYLIVRWGESLLPFEEIKKKVLKKHLKNGGFSELSAPIQKFILDEFSKDPKARFTFNNGVFFQWHCNRLATCVFRSNPSNGEVKYFAVCGKCGHFKESDTEFYSF